MSAGQSAPPHTEEEPKMALLQPRRDTYVVYRALVWTTDARHGTPILPQWNRPARGIVGATS